MIKVIASIGAMALSIGLALLHYYLFERDFGAGWFSGAMFSWMIILIWKK